MRFRTSVVALLALSSITLAQQPQYVPGRSYPLDPKQGPWMVLVKAFRGPEAVEYAEALIRELRAEHRIEAFMMVRRTQASQSFGSFLTRKTRDYDEAAVLAGSFSSPERGYRMRDKICSIRPKCITRDMTSRRRWEEGVLGTAFMVRNPLAPKDNSAEKLEPFVVKLNRSPYSILRCPNQFSLRVLTFKGTSLLVPYNKDAEYEKKLKKDSLLKLAADRAELAAEQLRKVGFEAYTFHDRTSSIVTVGGFNSRQDPRIVQVANQIRGKKVNGFTVARVALIPVPRS